MSSNIRKCTFGHVRPTKIQASLIRLFTGQSLDSQWCSVSSGAQQRLWSDCAGWFESSVGTHQKVLFLRALLLMPPTRNKGGHIVLLFKCLSVSPSIPLHSTVRVSATSYSFQDNKLKLAEKQEYRLGMCIKVTELWSNFIARVTYPWIYLEV